MTSSNSKKFAVVYCRFSSNLQKETSIERQKELAKVYCKRNQIQIVKTFVDRGISSKETKNLEFELGKAVKLSKDDTRITHFVTENMDRLSRENPITFMSKFSDFLLSGITIVQSDTGEELKPTQSMDQMRLFFSQFLGSEENRKKGKRVQESFIRRIHTKEACPKILFGYKRKSKIISIHKERSKVVKRVFREYSNGFSYNKIAKKLNADNILSPGACTGNLKWGHGWSATAVQRILQNTAYIDGNQETKHGTIKGAYIPIISPKVADKVKERLSVVRSYNKKSERFNTGTASNLFSNLFYCAECGNNYLITVRKNAKYRRYGCLQKSRGNCDNTFTADVDNVESLVLEHLLEYIDTSNLKDLIEQIQDQTDKEKAKLTKKKKENTRQLKKSDQLLTQIVDKYAGSSNKIIAETLEKKIEEKQETIKALELECSNIEREIEISDSKVENTTSRISSDLGSLQELMLSGGYILSVDLGRTKIDGQNYRLQLLEDSREEGQKFYKDAESTTRDCRLQIKSLLAQIIKKLTIDKNGKVIVYLRTGDIKEMLIASHSSS